MKIVRIFFLILIFFGTAESQNDSIFAVISSDTVTIWNTGAYANCAARFVMEVNISSDTIYVTEFDTASVWAFCMCDFDLNTKIIGLDPGFYFVEVFRKFKLAPGIVNYIGSTSFNYGGLLLNPFSTIYYQSTCKPGTAIGEEDLPVRFQLFSNYPNPFNPGTIIEFTIPYPAFVTLKIFNVMGEEIETLVSETLDLGKHKISWNPQSVGSGVYYYQLRAGNFLATKKLILIK